jgi:hypothetical protein
MSPPSVSPIPHPTDQQGQNWREANPFVALERNRGPTTAFILRIDQRFAIRQHSSNSGAGLSDCDFLALAIIVAEL